MYINVLQEKFAKNVLYSYTSLFLAFQSICGCIVAVRFCSYASKYVCDSCMFLSLSNSILDNCVFLFFACQII